MTAAFDEWSLLGSLTIDPEPRPGLNAAGLQRDISIAITNAERPAPTTTSGTDKPAEEVGLISSILSGLTSGPNADKVLYSTDLETVTIMTMWSELLTINCATVWLTSSSDSTISDEIVRVVNLALQADDPFNKKLAMTVEFLVDPDAHRVCHTYATAARALKASMDTGAEQFTGFATTLTFAATSYREAEETNVAEIAKSVSTLESI